MICSDTESTDLLKDYSKVVVTGISLTIVILILMVFGWDSLQDTARIIFHQSISSRLEKEIDTKFFQMYPDYAKKLAREKEIIKLAQGQTVPDNQHVMITLQTAKQISGASIVYVMDHAGTVIGCSPFNQGESLTGENYSFRPYFIEAMKGKSPAYPALGVTTNLRGLYFSAPIYSRVDRLPIGAVVFKTLLDPIDATLDRITEPVALLSPDGIVFATNRKDWMYHSALPVEKETVASIRKSRQFSDQALLPLQTPLDGKTVEIDGVNYTVRRLPIMIKGWQIGTLASLEVNYAIPTQQLLVFWGGLAILVILSVSTVVLLFSISKRRIVERELRRTEEKYRSIFENAVEGIIQITLEGRFLSANPTLAAMLGYSTPNELMTTITDIPSQIFVNSNRWVELIRRLRQDRAASEFDAEFYRKDHSVVIISINARIVEETDRSAYIDGFLNDISKRKQTEKALLESEERYRSLFNNISDFVYTHDLSGKILNINRIPAQSLGYTREELVGTKFSDIMPEEHKWSFLNEYLPEIMEKKQKRGHFVFLAKDGPEHIISYNNHLVMEKKDAPFVRGSARDITEHLLAERERKNLETQLRQAQKMEAIGTLAGGIAHDFNNILSAILGYSELCLNDIGPGSLLYDNLREVLRAGHRAKDLVRQILAFSRQGETDLQSVEMAVIIKEALKLLRSTLPTTIEITAQIDSRALIMADPTQIHQIVMNLCTNAAYSMEKNGGVIDIRLIETNMDESVTCEVQLVPGPYLQLTVMDSGEGIAPEHLEFIFEPYFSTKPEGEGTGLGLSVVHGIVHSYGGDIRVRSKRGQGTIFDIYLPILKRQELEIQNKNRKLVGGTEKVLIVDDEPPIAIMTSQQLERLGYRVEIKTDSREALELFKKRQADFDLVITDMTMPHITGDKLAQEILKISPGIPIILCTGFSRQMSGQRAARIGITEVATKPLVGADLAQLVRKVLDEDRKI